MPFNDKKVVTVDDFMKQVHARIEKGGNSDALLFYEIFLQKGFLEKIKATAETVPGWDGSAIAGDFDFIYKIAASILHDAASREYSEVHPNIYKDAHAISVAFCEELNEFFECSGEDRLFDLIPIKSYVEMAVEAGTVKVEGGFVKLTPEGEELAQSVEREI